MDASFNTGTGADNDINTTIISGDGKIIIGGPFNIYNGNVYFRANNDSVGFEIYMIPLNPVPGIFEINSKDFNIYPNPTTGTFHIRMDSFNEYNCQIMDINGREIYHTVINNEFEYTFPENVSAGIYIVRLANQESVMYGRISLAE